MMRNGTLLPALALIGVSTFAQGNSAAPASVPQDRHDGMSITADPYVDPARAKVKFGSANPLEAGILPLEVFLHNETVQPIRVTLDTIQLEVRLPDGSRQDVDWLRPVEVAYLIAHHGGPANPTLRRLPLPIPLPSQDKKTEKLAEILRPLALDADIVPPMGIIHGFLYFNLSHDMTLVPKSSLYLPDAVVIPTAKPLMFFEIPLGPAPSR
jgi:hypothetical protein